MNLPDDFLVLMREHLGPEQAERLFAGLQEEPSVSIRLNPLKAHSLHLSQSQSQSLTPIPWCPGAYWLDERPAFTFDPLFHAGVYYVQEASSMYLDEILRRYMPEGDLLALDLCAAPGGKSTLIRSRLTPSSLLVSNEPMRQRAQVLAENMTKWGYPNTVVTQNFPDDFAHLTSTFHLIVADVPCSGEGMFRKDPQAVADWSLENVETCWRRQQQIVESIWPTLQDGGLFIYSTCTFNRFEDEDNVRWIASTLGAELLEQRHFFPGQDRGEGFFIAALRKQPADSEPRISEEFQSEDFESSRKFSKVFECPRQALTSKLHRTLRVLFDSNETQPPVDPQPAKAKGNPKGQRSPLPSHQKEDQGTASHALAMSTALDRSQYPTLELSYTDAIAYLRREALHTSAPRGLVLITYQGIPLGFVKSIGNRLNNLYPQEWRIRTTYTQPFTPLL